MLRRNAIFLGALGAAAILCLFAAPLIVAATAKPAVIKAAAADFPAGIRIGIARLPIAKGAGLGDDRGGGADRQKEVQGVVFADAAGHPLYFSATGVGCTGACLQKWRPAIAATD